MGSRPLLVMLLALCLPACSLLFAPTAASEDGGAGFDGRSVFDAGVIDAASDAEPGEPDASIFGVTYNFEDGEQGWQLEAGCDVGDDPSEAANRVVCCNANNVTANPLMFLEIGSTREVEITFRLLLQTAQEKEFSVVMGTNDNAELEEPMLANLDQRPVANDTELARFGVAGSGSDPSTTPPVLIGEWLDVVFSASTATDCYQATATVPLNQTSSTVVHPLESGLPEFSHVLFGVIRQPTTQTTQRCFDDITIRARHTCNLQPATQARP